MRGADSSSAEADALVDGVLLVRVGEVRKRLVLMSPAKHESRVDVRRKEPRERAPASLKRH